jgi:hypothetical protein
VRAGEGKAADLGVVVLEHQRIGLLVSEALGAADDGVGELDMLDRTLFGEG